MYWCFIEVFVCDFLCIDVCEDVLYVDIGSIIILVGLVIGMDMMLYMVCKDYGVCVVNLVVEWLVLVLWCDVGCS